MRNGWIACFRQIAVKALSSTSLPFTINQAFTINQTCATNQNVFLIVMAALKPKQ